MPGMQYETTEDIEYLKNSIQKVHAISDFFDFKPTSILGKPCLIFDFQGSTSTFGYLFGYF